MDPRVRFKGQELKLSFHWYVGAAHLTLRLRDARTEEHVGWASAVFAHEAGLKPNQVLVHDWGETKGMLRALEEAGIIRTTGQRAQWHGLSLPVAELAIEPPAGLKEKAERIAAGLKVAEPSFFDKSTSEPTRAPAKQKGRDCEPER